MNQIQIDIVMQWNRRQFANQQRKKKSFIFGHSVFWTHAVYFIYLYMSCLEQGCQTHFVQGHFGVTN